MYDDMLMAQESRVVENKLLTLVEQRLSKFIPMLFSRELDNGCYNRITLLTSKSCM